MANLTHLRRRSNGAVLIIAVWGQRDRRWVRILAGVLTWVSFAWVFSVTSAAQAATVELTVRQDDGRPLVGREAQLRLERRSLERNDRSRYWQLQARLGRWMTLNSAGQIRLEGILPGTYTVELDLRDTRWIPPDKNPLRPSPTFTVTDRDEVLAIEVEVFRGVPVQIALDLPVDVEGFEARLQHPASGAVKTVRLWGDGRPVQFLLPRGIWQVEVIPQQGFLLVEILKDRQDWVGTQVVLDLISEDLRQDLVFAFSASVEVEGSLVELNRYPLAVHIQATLLEPGPWHGAALARGVQIPQQVEAYLRIDGTYHMWLPEGRWQIEPVGERLISSTPANVVRSLSAGDFLRADFTVELEPPEEIKGSFLRARVVFPRRHGHEDAVGEGAVGAVFDGGTTPESPGTPLWTGRAEYGTLAAPNMPPGEYLVVAGHEDALETRRTVTHDPEDPTIEVAELVLEEGVSVNLRAQNVESKRLGGLELRVERLDELPPLLLRDSAFIEAKKRRVIRSDLAGNGRATGFYAGRYRFIAQMPGERQAMGITEVRAGGAWKPYLEIDVGAAEHLEIEARERPAARITARLDCSDDWGLPETTAVRLLDTYVLDEDPIVDLESLILSGRRNDRLVIGPLEADTVVVGLRPEGFARWSWVYGAETPDKAEGVLIESADRDARRAIDLGPLLIECGPAVDLWPKVASGAPFPSLRDLRMSARSISQATEQGLTVLDLKRRKGRLEVRGMPRGEQVLEVTLEHPWFLPSSELTWELPFELERGMYHQVTIEVEALGGAIDLRGFDEGGRRFVRAVGGEWASELVPLLQERAVIPSLVPGLWRVELCLTVDCQAPRDLGTVEVRIAETSKLSVDG